MKIKFTQFEIYANAIEIYYNSAFAALTEINDKKKIIALQECASNFTIITKFMLEDRFAHLIKEKKESTNFSPDVKKYLGLPLKKKVVEELSLLDILKFFKICENFILKKKYMVTDLKDLKLGKFRPHCEIIFDSLPTLLLSVEVITPEKRELILNYIFSLVRIYRQFKIKALPDISTITAEYTGTPIDELLESEFSEDKMMKWIHKSFKRQSLLKENLRLSIYSGNASSPNSGASSSKFFQDMAAIHKGDTRLEKALTKMAKQFVNYNDYQDFVGPMWGELMLWLEECFHGYWGNEANSFIHSRLFSFTAPGGKARIIANVDWLTQSTLSALHYFYFSLLKEIFSDFTFDHKGGIPYLFNEGNKNNKYYSVDLSAATDRMPRLLQQGLIKCLANSSGLDGLTISEQWSIIVDRSYSTKKSGLNNDLPIKYAVGQGMGMFTSWPIMALLHHYIVNYVCGIDQDDYVLVGDDLLIRNNTEGYLKYLSILEKIGMKVNLNKTIVSEDVNNVTIEFASNFIINNIKIEPIQYGTLLAWSEDLASFESVIYNMNEFKSATVIDLLDKFKHKINIYKLGYILTYLTKKKIEFKIDDFCKIIEIPEWFKSIDFNKIVEISDDSKNRKLALKPELSKFMTNATSQYVVRTDKDIENSVDIANRYKLMLEEDIEFRHVIDIIYVRVNNVSLVKYDTDGLGNPLVTKREKLLLKDIIKMNYEMRKISKDIISDK